MTSIYVGTKTKDWVKHHKEWIQLWDQHRTRIAIGEPWDGNMHDDDPYMVWYLRITRRYISRAACTFDFVVCIEEIKEANGLIGDTIYAGKQRKRGDPCPITWKRFKMILIKLCEIFYWIGWLRLQRNTNLSRTPFISLYPTLTDSYLIMLIFTRTSQENCNNLTLKNYLGYRPSELKECVLAIHDLQLSSTCSISSSVLQLCHLPHKSL
ncbi:uncharacterized protein LOC114309791 isoform X2 [Camellia sinensis]|uniref:uncharacterized protein LOC114309791 isoform X2 n=1 Tax=Camellia sinensis TaxID=4442 RepID=UPI0010362E6B|nr:uncharacterized protein LOC114309791 isoform X2 [Camellia sinensis]